MPPLTHADVGAALLQFMHDKHRQSFNNMFGQIIGRPRTRKSVSIHKLLNSTFEPERPIIRSVSSDFCERDSVDFNGETMVHWCCRSGEVQRLQTLLGEGFGLQTKNKKGETPLHVACFAGNAPCCQVLAMKGADVNATDADGWGALHWAVEQNNHECAKMLITHRADLDLRLRSGKTPLDLAVSADTEGKKMMALLQEQEAAGKVSLIKNQIVNKALTKFLRRKSKSQSASQKDAIGEDKHILLVQNAPKWRHLKAAAAERRGRKPRINMKTLLNEAIQCKSFQDSDAIKHLMQGGGHAAMVYFLRSCDAGTQAEVVMPLSLSCCFDFVLHRPSFCYTLS